MRLFSIAIAAALAASSVHAAEDCTGYTDDAVRLSCFDSQAHAAKGLPPSPKQAAPSSDTVTPRPSPALDPAETPPQADAPTVTTTEIVKPISPEDYKNTAPADLRVAPNKFMDKPIELRGVHCFYADKDEYRCIALSEGSVVAVFGADIVPESAKSKLEEDCGTIKAMNTRACLRSIHFVPKANSEEQINAFISRVVVVTPKIEIVTLPTRKKR